MIQLGDKVKDKITGYTGIVVARTEWLNKCVRICVQAQEMKDGKPVDNYTFDQEQLELIESKSICLDKPRPTGGPTPDAVQRPEVKR